MLNGLEAVVVDLEEKAAEAQQNPEKIRAIFTDLDDTFWRWPLIYVEPMRQMLEALCHDLSMDFDEFCGELKLVHRAHSDTEYPLSILEAPSIIDLYGTDDKRVLKTELQVYFDIYNDTRHDNLVPALYGRVHHALAQLKEAGVHLLAYTDANACAVTRNLHEMGMVNFFDKVVCRGDHELIPGVHTKWLEARAAFAPNQLEILAPELHKPQPQVLVKLLDLLNAKLTAEGTAANDLVQANEVIWMGDSLKRDMEMAQVYNDELAAPGQQMKTVHAEYGTFTDLKGNIRPDPVYEQRLPEGMTKEILIKVLIQKLSYWSDKQDEDEAKSKAEEHTINRSVTLSNSYEELLDYPPVAAALLASQQAANVPLLAQYQHPLEPLIEEENEQALDMQATARAKC